MPSEQLDRIVRAIRKRKSESTAVTLEENRVAFNEAAREFPLANGTVWEPARANGVDAEWISAPGASADRIIFYLHGGAYVFGTLMTARPLASRVSQAAKARVLSIDYRLAPENPYPAALEDSVAAYRWLLAQGTDPSRVVITGVSAGGGLTVATLLALRDAGESLPAAAVLISPWADLECSCESATTKADVDPVIEPEPLRLMGRFYAGETDLRDPLVSPVHADLHALPPLFIQVGTAETLLDDSTRLAQRAQAAGVDVALEQWEGMIHVWHNHAAVLPEGQQAIDRIGEFVAQHVP
jgi:acetyl esterase/lipase